MALRIYIKIQGFRWSVHSHTSAVSLPLSPSPPPLMWSTCTTLFPAATVALLHIRLLVETSLSSWASLRSISAWNTSFWSCFSTTPKRTTFKRKHTWHPRQVSSKKKWGVCVRVRMYLKLMQDCHKMPIPRQETAKGEKVIMNGESPGNAARESYLSSKLSVLPRLVARSPRNSAR